MFWISNGPHFTPLVSKDSIGTIAKTGLPLCYETKLCSEHKTEHTVYIVVGKKR